jgi:hypothetical protein
LDTFLHDMLCHAIDRNVKATAPSIVATHP